SVLMVGMNDVNRDLYAKERQTELGIKEQQEEALAKYFTNVDSIVRLLIKAGSKVILQTPSIYDQTAEIATPNFFGVNDALGRCAEFVKTLSVKYKLPVVDYWTIMNTVNTAVQKADPTATIIGSDRVHPDVDGHFLMTGEFLKIQHVPGYVSYLCIDARKHKIVKARQCDITKASYDNSTISFTCHETSLPYPLLSKSFNPDSLFSFNDEFNREILKITSLKRGDYLLTIDSLIAGTYSEEDFNKGINLAGNVLTPQYRQSEKVLELLSHYWELERKLRQIKYVEYQLLDGEIKEFQHIDDSSSNRFEKKLESFNDQPRDNIDFYKRNFDEYIINKPIEEELKVKADESFKEIHAHNKSLKHNYQLMQSDR
ncbi:MAG: hypothetical protein ABJA71_14365, partial [Ginsengibacter sp.]